MTSVPSISRLLMRAWAPVSFIGALFWCGCGLGDFIEAGPTGVGSVLDSAPHARNVPRF